MKNRFLIIVYLIGSVMTVTDNPAHAESGMITAPQRAFLLLSQNQPREKLADYGRLKRMVERRFKGRVVNQELRRNATPPTYRFRLVREDGSVVDVVVNARTGEIMSVKG